MQAGLSVAMQIGTGNVQVIGADAPVQGYDGVIRVSQAPIERLHARHRLDEADPARNRQLFEAGVKLMGYHHCSGLSGFVAAANDPGRVGRTDPSQRVSVTETMERGRRALRQAEAAMNAGDWLVVQAVVIHERDLGDVGHQLGFSHHHAAASVALDRLRRGLEELAHLWGFMPPRPTRYVASMDPANGNAAEPSNSAA